MQEKKRYHFPIRETVALSAKLILLGLALGVIALVISPLAAAISGCVVLWVALALTVRSLHDEEDLKESELVGIQREHDLIISAMASAIGLKEDMRAGHGRRVSELASILAQQMSVGEEDVQVIQQATVLADVGKLQISQSILSKEGELSEEEWLEMQRHPELGSRILADVLRLSGAGEIVLAHHERFDGAGYPHGLKGDDIPLGARIYAVADSYIAMTSDRPHRKKMPHDRAMREILRSSMTQFDPDVVRAFVSAADEGLIGPPSESGNRGEIRANRFVEDYIPLGTFVESDKVSSNNREECTVDP
jgi:HD-GYP domain-containing protein (c-di-GMP phosphodiesterase class II)